MIGRDTPMIVIQGDPKPVVRAPKPDARLLAGGWLFCSKRAGIAHMGDRRAQSHMSQVLATRDSGRPESRQSCAIQRERCTHGRFPHAGGVCSTLSTIPPRWASSAPLQTGPTSGETHMLSRQFAAYDRRARPETLTRSWALLHATPHGLSCKKTQQLQLPMFPFVLFLELASRHREKISALLLERR